MSGENEVRIGFEVAGAAGRGLLPVEAAGQEAISRLWEYEVSLASEDSALALDSLVGKEATLSLAFRSGERRVRGIVCAARRGGTLGKYTLYQATLVPPVWALSLGADCRIFQKRDALAIVTKLIRDAGVTVRSDVRPGATPPERDYCVQYREPDWWFISRLLEEEGLHYALCTEDGRCVVRISDDSRTCPAVEGEAELPVVEPSDRAAGAEEVYALGLRRRALPRVVTLADYNQARPSVKLLAGGAEGGAALADMEVYDHPGGFGDLDRGKQLSQVRVEEQQAGAEVVEGRSDCPRLAAGTYFEAAGEAPRDLAGERLLVTRVEHRFAKSSEVLEGGALDGRCTYDNAFGAIRRSVRFRPPRVTRRPTIQGVQSARVVGPDQEEIYTDSQGRVKVRFPWDRGGGKDENASCWIRVSQLWAGARFGAMWIPRVGQEVIVDFLEGDPDRPIITGRVYNGKNPPPHDLPQHKTRSTILSHSTPGGDGRNELSFEDRKGGEQVFIHAERDQDEVVKRNHTTRVGNDQKLDVDRDEEVRIGRHRDETVEGNERIAVEGRREERVGQDEEVLVQGNRTHRVDGAQSVRVRRDGALRVVKSALERVGLRRRVTVGSHQAVEVGADMTVKVGRDLVQRVARAISESAGTKKTVHVGEQFEVVCGKSRLVMHRSGRILLEGTNIKVKCNGPVGIRGKAMVLKGRALKVLMDGVIKLKGSSVEEN